MHAIWQQNLIRDFKSWLLLRGWLFILFFNIAFDLLLFFFFDPSFIISRHIRAYRVKYSKYLLPSRLNFSYFFPHNLVAPYDLSGSLSLSAFFHLLLLPFTYFFNRFQRSTRSTYTLFTTKFYRFSILYLVGGVLGISFVHTQSCRVTTVTEIHITCRGWIVQSSGNFYQFFRQIYLIFLDLPNNNFLNENNE